MTLPRAPRTPRRATIPLCPCGTTGWWTRDGVTRCAGCERVLLVTWSARAEEAT